MSLDPTLPIYASPANNNPCGDAWNPDLPASANVNTYCSPDPYWSPDMKRLLSGMINSIDPIMQASLGICKTNEYLAAGGVSTAGKYYCAIVVIADAVLNVAAGQTNEKNGFDNSDINLAPLTGITLKAGTILYGNFAKVVLVSGLVKIMGHPTR